MAALTDAAREWLAAHQRAVLITTRADGSPQSSNVLATFDGTAFRVSVTADRAKTRNLARDPRAVMHVLGEDFWAFASVSCTAGLSPVTREPGDEAGQALLATYEAIAGKPHPDPAEFFGVQVDERRLVLTLTATGVVGAGW
jgi:uncharacterized protein